MHTLAVIAATAAVVIFIPATMLGLVWGAVHLRIVPHSILAMAGIALLYDTCTERFQDDLTIVSHTVYWMGYLALIVIAGRRGLLKRNSTGFGEIRQPPPDGA